MTRTSNVLTLGGMASLALAAATAGPAAAEPDLLRGSFIEAVLGLAVPVAEEDYEDTVDESLKLASVSARAAPGGPGRPGFELSRSTSRRSTPSSTRPRSTSASSAHRGLHAGVSATACRRARAPCSCARASARALVHLSASGSILGINFETSQQTDVGLAAEVGAGLRTVPIGGNLYVGAHFAVPMAFHFDDDDPGDPASDTDFEYTGVDLDLLFTIGTCAEHSGPRRRRGELDGAGAGPGQVTRRCHARAAARRGVRQARGRR
ncbi:MAG: hypothetical protein HS111_17645 [Kofleriaceae bacterium]|nr:hypothetical protein [Kofleriaceae bacterium]